MKFTRNPKKNKEVNASSMADIAFLLLIFFLVTTTIQNDKGITMLLPPSLEQDTPEVDIHDRNLLKILVNSNDQLMVEGEISNTKALGSMAFDFLNNNGKSGDYSDTPQKAVISLKADRATSYETYITVLDAVKRAYHSSRADYLGISLNQYNALDRKNPEHKAMLDKAKTAFPMQISEAETNAAD